MFERWIGPRALPRRAARVRAGSCSGPRASSSSPPVRGSPSCGPRSRPSSMTSTWYGSSVRHSHLGRGGRVRSTGRGDEELRRAYRQALTPTVGWSLAEIDADIAVLAARLRVRHGLTLPDAMQLAVALRVAMRSSHKTATSDASRTWSSSGAVTRRKAQRRECRRDPPAVLQGKRRMCQGLTPQRRRVGGRAMISGRGAASGASVTPPGSSGFDVVHHQR
jgi:hypothetical protein